MGKNRRIVFEFLGTGTSTGVPMAACSCRVCRSRDRRDKRLRTSALVRSGRRNVVFDTGPEFRMQMLRAGVMRLDGVILTHDHADHTMGFDDVRAYSFRQANPVPVWAAPAVLADVRRRFRYIWKPAQRGGGLPEVDLRRIAGTFAAGGVEFLPIPIRHGILDILGFRVGDLAYLTDMSELPDSSLPLLRGLKTLVLGCVRRRPHATHLHVAGCKRMHRLIRPERTLLTHLTHNFLHAELKEELKPFGIEPAYDGMRVEVDTGRQA